MSTEGEEDFMVVGFTGTRRGMTLRQVKAVRKVLSLDKIKEAHHGDCLGADEQFHMLCLDLGIPVVLHPPVKPKWRAYCKGAVRVEPEREYLARNKDIVNACTFLVATPHKPGEVIRSGTWATVRYARSIDRTLQIVFP